MHSRAGRRRIISRTSTRNSNPNEFQLDDENHHPDNNDDDDDDDDDAIPPYAAPRPASLVPSCCGNSSRGAMTTRVTTLVLLFTAGLFMCHLILRLASLLLTPKTTWWFTDNNGGGPAVSGGGAASSRNQQRMERKRQRQRHNSAVGRKKAKEQENWKVPFREQQQQQQQQDFLMNPHDSHPPDVIPLFSTTATSLLYLSETALQRRHECIAAIRKRHNELLGPFLTTSTGKILRHENHREENQRMASLTTRPNVLLVDPAYHKNVGDHMITLGEIEFLQKMGYTALSSTNTARETDAAENNNLLNNNAVYYYEECTYFQGGPFLPLCDDLLNQQQQQQQQQQHEPESALFLHVALWHGGGNWGDLWPKMQSLRASSLEPLYTAFYNPIISMPQSLHFDDEKVFQQENANVMRQAVMKEMQQQQASTTTSITTKKQQKGLNLSPLIDQHEQRRLILTWREQKSHDVAVKLYPFATNLVVPDIAFQLGPFAPIIENSVVAVVDGENDQTTMMAQQQQKQQLDILLLLRDDHESLYLHQRNRQAIRQMLSSITVKKRNNAGAAGTTTTGEDSDTTTSMAGNRLLFAIVDWSDRLDRFESASSSSFGKRDIFFTNTSIQLLSLGRVLICDRLHAAILAYLMGIPFVFVDQSTGKIHQTLHTAFTSASSSSFLAAAGNNANHNDTITPADGHHYSPCLDATAAMWAQADNLTHALERAIGFLGSGN